MAKVNPIQFSTKYQDGESDLLYYGFRYYNSSQGRWLEMDPLEENGGLNLYGFGGNNAINAMDFLGLDIVCHCIDSYLHDNGISSELYSVSGDTYSATIPVPGAGPHSGAGQILYKMLQSSLKFTIVNEDVENLKLHVQTRQNVVAAISGVHWAFGADSDQIFNHNVWISMMERQGNVTASAAVNDPFNNPSLYQTGCRNTSLLILLKGIEDTIGAHTFDYSLAGGSLYVAGAAQEAGLLRVNLVAPGGENPTLRDWIPGDRGYIMGGSSGGGNHLADGEWIIYKGGIDDHFWGFDGQIHDETLLEMMASVRGFSAGYAYESGERWYPGVGISRVERIR